MSIDDSICSLADFGCGDGKLMRYVKKNTNLSHIFGIDKDRYLVERYCLENSNFYLMDHDFPRPKQMGIYLFTGDILKPEPSIIGVDAISCIELVEHLQIAEVDPFLDLLLGYYKPKMVIITTPNKDFNVVFDMKTPFRHPDHKFEWTRKEFNDWCARGIKRHPSYTYELTGVGDPPLDPPGFEDIGFGTQIAVFRSNAARKSVQFPEDLENNVKSWSFFVRIDYAPVPESARPPTPQPYDWHKWLKDDDKSEQSDEADDDVDNSYISGVACTDDD